jgi:hypothetical protein
MTSDDRMTWALVGEILDALERHGYHRYDHQHTAQAVGAIADLAGLYDGTRDPTPAAYPLSESPHAEPGPSDPDADDAVILTGAEASTVFAALTTAADHHRDRAEMCADCADQTCPTCQSRLRDARAYDQMATQILHTAQAAQAASTHQPEPSGPSGPPHQPHPIADKEAGQ